MRSSGDGGCILCSYIVHKYTPCCVGIPCFSLLRRPAPTVYRVALLSCCPYTDIHTAPTIYRHAPPCCCIPLSIGIYRTLSRAPLRMPLKRSYFNSSGLLLLGYKYPASIVKTLYSLILTVSWLSGGIRLFGCCNRGVVYRVPHGVGWGIYDILRGAGYSLYHTPHIKRGEIRRLACVRPLLARRS